jgi:hypothetical protein
MAQILTFPAERARPSAAALAARQATRLVEAARRAERIVREAQELQEAELVAALILKVEGALELAALTHMPGQAAPVAWALGRDFHGRPLLNLRIDGWSGSETHLLTASETTRLGGALIADPGAAGVVGIGVSLLDVGRAMDALQGASATAAPAAPPAGSTPPTEPASDRPTPTPAGPDDRRRPPRPPRMGQAGMILLVLVLGLWLGGAIARGLGVIL